MNLKLLLIDFVINPTKSTEMFRPAGRHGCLMSGHERLHVTAIKAEIVTTVPRIHFANQEGTIVS